MSILTLLLNTEQDGAVVFELVEAPNDAKGKYLIIDEESYDNFDFQDLNIVFPLENAQAFNLDALRSMLETVLEPVVVDERTTTSNLLANLPVGFVEQVNNFIQLYSTEYKNYMDEQSDVSFETMNEVIKGFYKAIDKDIYVVS